MDMNFFMQHILFPILIAAAISLVICLIMKTKMKTAVHATEADRYVDEQHVELTVHSDRYTHSTTTTVKVADSSGKKK